MDLATIFVMLFGMANIVRRPGWFVPDEEITPEEVYFNRRKFLKELGFVGSAALLAQAAAQGQEAAKPPAKGYPFPRNKEFELAEAKVTEERLFSTFNNFYEFSTS